MSLPDGDRLAIYDVALGPSLRIALEAAGERAVARGRLEVTAEDILVSMLGTVPRSPGTRYLIDDYGMTAPLLDALIHELDERSLGTEAPAHDGLARLADRLGAQRRAAPAGAKVLIGDDATEALIHARDRVPRPGGAQRSPGPVTVDTDAFLMALSGQIRRTAAARATRILDLFVKDTVLVPRIHADLQRAQSAPGAAVL